MDGLQPLKDFGGLGVVRVRPVLIVGPDLEAGFRRFGGRWVEQIPVDGIKPPPTVYPWGAGLVSTGRRKRGGVVVLVPRASRQAHKHGLVILVRVDEKVRDLDPHIRTDIEMHYVISNNGQCHRSKVLEIRSLSQVGRSGLTKSVR